jgi:hypothetical protein
MFRSIQDVFEVEGGHHETARPVTWDVMQLW